MWLVVGLGNPGRQYARTRHNIGFQALERLGERWGAQVGARKQLGCLVGDGQVGGERCVFAQPQGYMNRSGQPVASLAGYYKVPVDRVVVLHDDIDLPFTSVRCKAGGGHGGHNGLRDLHAHLGRDFLRVRMGVGRPPEGWDPADYVLGRWTAEEEAELPALLDEACDATEVVLREGLEVAMNRFNVRPGRGRGDAFAEPVGPGQPSEQNTKRARGSGSGES